jgi:hypothetical protein
MRTSTLGIVLSAMAPIVLAISAQAAPDENDAAKVKEPGFGLELVTSKARFEQGDSISITLRFTSTAEGTKIAFFQPGLIMGLTFSAKTNDGAVARDIVPMPDDAWGGSGTDVIGNPKPGHPFDYKVLLNEYSVFDKPGTYQITATFRKVTSAPLDLEILLPNHERRAKRLAAAERAIQIPKDANAGDEQRAAAIELGCMLDERSIPALLANVHCNPEAIWALRTFKDMAPVKEGILKFLDDPDVRLDDVDIPDVVWTLALAEISGHGPALKDAGNHGLDAALEKCRKIATEKLAKRAAKH